MSSQDVFTYLLDPLVVVYGEPKTSDVGAFLREYAGLMADFTVEELQHAKASIMRKHEYRSFPTPGECIKACEEARKELSPLWGDAMRARIAACVTLERLDALWTEEIDPRRNRVSKSTFDAVKSAANMRAIAITSSERTRRMTGEAAE